MGIEADTLKRLWQLQAAQQRELGLAPDAMSDVERRHHMNELVVLLHEEATSIGLAAADYKRHLLRAREGDRASIAEEVADALKTLLIIAQLKGLTPEELAEAFERKTAVVARRAEGERLELQEATRLICVDLDDCVCNLEPWRHTLTGGIDVDAPPPDRLAAAEQLKDQFYRGGRFREMDVIPGAVEALRSVRAAGYTIVFVTARPQWQYKRLYADTIGWLRDHGVPYDLVLFNKDKVEAIHEHIVPAWPRAFVEDHERNARALAAVGVPVLLFNQEHNRHVPESEHIRRVMNWTDVLRALGLSATAQSVA